MLSSSRKTTVVVAGLVLVGVTAPLVLYGILFGSLPTVLPPEAKRLLGTGATTTVVGRALLPVDPSATGTSTRPADATLNAGAVLSEDSLSATLVDVRPPAQFSAGHIEGAVNWPLEDIRATRSPDQIPAELRGRTLLLLCDVGMASRLAVRHLSQIDVEPVFNVRGGIQEWLRNAPQPEGQTWDRWRTRDGVGSLPFRESPPFEQALAVLSYFVVKPTYMLLSLVIVAALWTSLAGDIVALRWGLIAFFLGEAACAVNYFGYQETSYLWEYLHGAGMFVSFSFIAYAVLEGVDHRILGLSDPERRCTALRLCGACSKHADVPCGLHRCFYLLLAALLAITLIVPTADWHDNSYNTLIFGASYNYGHLRVFQQVENWYYPAVAMVLFSVSLTILFVQRRDPIPAAKLAFAAGLGPLGFGMFRMLLGAAYDQHRVWFLVWEETTEFLLISGICGLLWIFHRGLFPDAEQWLRSIWVHLNLAASVPTADKSEA